MANTLTGSSSHALYRIQTKLTSSSSSLSSECRHFSLQNTASSTNLRCISAVGMGKVQMKQQSLVSKALAEKHAQDNAYNQSIDLEVLRMHLESGEWEKADEETRRLLIVLAGEAAVKRKYVFFSEVRFISEKDLKAIDELWTGNSDRRFGYSVQRQIWKKCGCDFTEFFKRVGWMKKLESETEQFTYRSFPTEFFWELNDSTPEGHLPLTNALRGTQLLASVLQHPAFAFVDDEAETPLDDQQKKAGPAMGIKSFVPNYKF
eukprot:TRINITY_DN28999_c0_g1_i1.p1 TRINITY_DN28999_c0_g1~~TRINITY_DN28999_c0_g1_i1.p1  ORF type:complete len:262 (+),score=42.15 TRINITY_DN28999_c0_g1_i1:261-1046(+)